MILGSHLSSLFDSFDLSTGNSHTMPTLIFTQYDKEIRVPVYPACVEDRGSFMKGITADERLILLEDIEESIDAYLLVPENDDGSEEFSYDVMLLYHLGDSRVTLID